MREYRASPEELSEEQTREEEIQAVADLPERDVNKRDRADNIHGDHKCFIEDSQTCYCYERALSARQRNDHRASSVRVNCVR